MSEDESSLGYAAKTMLKGWESMSLEERGEFVARGLEVGEDTWGEEFIDEWGSAMEPAGVRTKWNGFYEIGGSRRPKSAVAAYGKVGPRDWERLGLAEPGIGPVVDGGMVVYPQTMGDTVGIILHQEGKFITGERVQEGGGGGEGNGNFFVNSWGREDRVETRRPNTVEAGDMRRGGRRSEGEVKVEREMVGEHQLALNSSHHEGDEERSEFRGKKSKRKGGTRRADRRTLSEGEIRVDRKGKVFRPIQML